MLNHIVSIKKTSIQNFLADICGKKCNNMVRYKIPIINPDLPENIAV